MDAFAVGDRDAAVEAAGAAAEEEEEALAAAVVVAVVECDIDNRRSSGSRHPLNTLRP